MENIDKDQSVPDCPMNETEQDEKGIDPNEPWVNEDKIKIAKDILSLVAKSNIQLGARDMPTEHVRYKELAMGIIDLLFRKNVKMIEVDIYFQLLRQAIAIAETAVLGSLDLSRNIALTNFWGKHPEEVTIQDIDVKMKKGNE